MTIEELIRRLQELPGDTSVMPIVCTRKVKGPYGRETAEYVPVDISREPMEIIIELRSM